LIIHTEEDSEIARMLETCAWLIRDFVIDSVSSGVEEDWSVGVLILLVSHRMKSQA